MKNILLTISLAISLCSSAENKYPVAAIPESLLKNAHVVKRMEDIRFEIINLQETVYTRRYALTILDENGQEYADFVVDYDKLKKINNIEGALYDAAGNQVKKVKGKDIRDISAVQDISLFDDNRLKVHDFEYHTYPYTVEYEVEVTYNNSYFFPSWVPQGFQNLSVEQSSYTFLAPENYQARYKQFQYNSTPVVTSLKGKKSMVWQVSNLLAITRPYAAPPWHELTTMVYFAPSEFEIQGYKANASSWQELGRFQSLLNENRDKLPANILEKIVEITEDISDPREKVKKLYEYFQQNTRYISIQLGIGGWQPFEASFVAQKGYGDCKALSNYMYSILKAAGIKSYYTKIRAGESLEDKYIIEDFPSLQSNHIILCVPFVKDTMWLECTSQTDPAGYLGSFTGNRKALAVTEEGGKLISTPHYGLEENLQVRAIKAVLNEEGDLIAEVKTKYRAQQQEYQHNMMNMLSKDKVKKMLNEELDFSTYEINDFSYTAKKDVLPEVDEHLQLAVSNYATVSGRRLFILPNLMTRSSKKPINPEGRSCDYVFDYAYRDVDSVEITIPAGYQLESLPQEVALKTSFGNYSSKIKVEGTKIIYYRKIENFAGRYPAKDGKALELFFNDIYKADRSRVVLVKKEG